MASSQDRVQLIKNIEKTLNTSLICYVTGDRENLNTRIAPDVIRIFYRHLKAIGPQEKISLFLYTRGGDVLTPWRLVNLLREYCNHLSILVPFRAYSAGTLICLGGDEIIMGKLGELSPIDPSVANAFNPQDRNNKSARIPVSVEDVTSFIGLAQEMAGLQKEEHIKDVFLRLSEKVHPLALGNVHRNYSLIRYMGKKLLKLHFKNSCPNSSDELINSIISNLTEELFAHNYMISRSEARESIRLPVTYPPEDLENIMWELYENYEECLHLTEPFNPALLLKNHEQQLDFEASGGIIESKHCLDLFVFEGIITRAPRKEGDQSPVNLEMIRQKWKNIR